MTQLLGSPLVLIGLVMIFKEKLLGWLPWLAERMPPGEPYGRDEERLIRQRQGSGAFLLAMGVLFLAFG